jgi:hypothetical protein
MCLCLCFFRISIIVQRGKKQLENKICLRNLYGLDESKLYEGKRKANDKVYI